MGARYYMPLLGRFTGIDPAAIVPEQPHSFNRYAYANNNPYRYIDPDGRFALPILAKAVAATVFLAAAANASMTPDQRAQVTQAFGQRSQRLSDALGRASNWMFNEGNWEVPEEARDKIPSEWGEGEPNRKGEGTRWQDPEDKGSGVRIDKGDPENSQPSQQVDHVVVRDKGRVIGRDGKPIDGSIKQNPSQSHIPMSEWSSWSKWNKP
jgi:uncharacterized protein RhaS with RHS repeats